MSEKLDEAFDVRVLLTKAERDALKWLGEHNGDGHFGGRGNTLMAAGEIAPVMRMTWNSLEKKGFVEFYSLRRRIRIIADLTKEPKP